MTCLPLAAESRTVKVICAVALVSVRLASVIERFGAGSSSVMVPVPVPLAMVALFSPERVTVKLSRSSSRVSPRTCTVMFCVVTPGLKVRVPVFAV